MALEKMLPFDSVCHFAYGLSALSRFSLDVNEQVWFSVRTKSDSTHLLYTTKENPPDQISSLTRCLIRSSLCCLVDSIHKSIRA